MEKHEEDGVCAAESADGNLDVWSCKNSDSSSADHLVVMVHGIMGSTGDWKFGAEQFVKMLPDKVFVHCSEKNASALTLDGVDVMGERLAAEVLEIIQTNPNIRKISFVAHSLGGLAARYAIGKLYKPANQGDEKDSLGDTSEGTICGLEAMNFITVATPHLGSIGNRQVPFLFGVSSFEKVAGLIIHWIFKRTGRHLFLKDEEEGKPPLLRRMAQDTGDCKFISALRAFKRRVAYSNVGLDHVVGWRTASIRRESELPKWENSLNEKYPHIVYEELCKACDAEDIAEGENHADDIEEEMIKGLSSVSWEKVDVSFHSSRQRFAAHSVIQVKNETMHIEGADVIEHIIDHFLT
uniref:Putative lipase ROG1 n=1 Tax=Noccaea caerulescens TaxID=107243 RepID=A0A1J3CTY5_NOCCA